MTDRVRIEDLRTKVAELDRMARKLGLVRLDQVVGLKEPTPTGDGARVGGYGVVVLPKDPPTDREVAPESAGFVIYGGILGTDKRRALELLGATLAPMHAQDRQFQERRGLRTRVESWYGSTLSPEDSAE